MYKILVVEDDISIAELERDYLELNGYQVVIKQEGRLRGHAGAENQRLCRHTYRHHAPWKNGFELCREIRKELDIPILIVTAKRDDVDLKSYHMGEKCFLTEKRKYWQKRNLSFCCFLRKIRILYSRKRTFLREYGE